MFCFLKLLIKIGKKVPVVYQDLNLSHNSIEGVLYLKSFQSLWSYGLQNSYFASIQHYIVNLAANKPEAQFRLKRSITQKWSLFKKLVCSTRHIISVPGFRSEIINAPKYLNLVIYLICRSFIVTCGGGLTRLLIASVFLYIRYCNLAGSSTMIAASSGKNM